ncbi:MAG: hypothetical protein C0603_08535 [Denitrovibrio sp.]|nr:MAG: hypothetical protein C0603_08535 [Denitrovibrio sp.]
MPSYCFFSQKYLKDAEVYWVGNFWKTNNGKWNVNVYLFDGEKVVQTYLPIGALPFLAVGAKVVDGYLRGSVPSEESKSLRIKDLTAGWFTTFGQMPRSLCSYYGNGYLANEKVYCYSAGHKTYFFPQAEIIRSLLATNSTLANSITTPEGLSFLIGSYGFEGDKLNLELSKEYPRKLLTHGNVIHLMSIFLEENLKGLWNSVYRHSITSPREKQMFDLIPLKGVKFHFKYKEFKRFILVTEIREISGLKPKFNHVSYSHPNVHEFLGKAEEQKRKIPKGSKDKRELDHITSPGLDNNRDVAWHDSVFVKISYKGISAEHTSKISDKVKKKIKNVEVEASKVKYTLRDHVGSGKGSPIELQSLTALPEDVDINGLEKFLKAIVFMERSAGAKVHRVIVRPLLSDSAFAKVGDKARNCAVVFVEDSVIVEFGRPDDYPISTLILSRYDKSRIKEEIKRILTSVLENNGHWDIAYLNGFHSFNYKFSKHSRIDTPEKWGARVLNKIHT